MSTAGSRDDTGVVVGQRLEGPRSVDTPSGRDIGEVAYRDLFGRRKWAVLLATVLGGLAATVVSMQQTPVYQAAATVVVESGVRESLYDNGATPAKVVQTEARMVTAPEVRAAVDERLGPDAHAADVSVVPVGGSSTFDVVAGGPDPYRAAETANAYAELYVQSRLKQVLADLEAAEREVRGKVDELQSQIDVLTPRLGAARPEERAAVDQTVGVRVSSLISAQGVFRQQLDQLQVARALRRGGVRVLAPAVPVTSPVEPLVERNLVLGASSGLFLGLAMALLLPVRQSG